MATPEEIAALDAQIAALAAKPASVTVDNMTVVNQRLQDLIAYRKSLTVAAAAGRSPIGRRFKMNPPGSV